MHQKGSLKSLYAAFWRGGNSGRWLKFFGAQRFDLKRAQGRTLKKISATALFGLIFPLLAHADIVISEIFYDAPGTDTHQEWIELYNTGPSIVDISKWKINDGASHVLNAPPKNGSMGPLTILPGAYLILADDASTFRAAHPIAASIIDTSLSLNNDGDTISLLNASGTVMASARYTSADGGAGDGNSLQKNNGMWIASLPTPGAVNATVATVGPNVKVPPPPKAPKVPHTPKISNSAKTRAAHVGSRRVAVAPLDLTSRSESGASADTSDPIVDVATSARAIAQTASILPANSMWMWAIAGLALLSMGGIYASRWFAKDEWEIEDMGETE